MSGNNFYEFDVDVNDFDIIIFDNNVVGNNNLDQNQNQNEEDIIFKKNEDKQLRKYISQRDYRENNCDRINCDLCGGHYTKFTLNKHVASKKHMKKLETL